MAQPEHAAPVEEGVDGKFLEIVTTHCAHELDVAAAGVLVREPDGHLTPAAVHARSPVLAKLFDLQAIEGPCRASCDTRAPVAVSDFASQDTRWPEFDRRARQAGVTTAYALPLQVDGVVAGSLGTVDTGRDRLDDRDIQTVTELAQIVSYAMFQLASARAAQTVVGQLQTALNRRTVVEQAKGMLAQSGGIDVEQAREALRRYARSHRRKLAELARDVIDGSADHVGILRCLVTNPTRSVGGRQPLRSERA